ncbi:hypothetical protein ACEPPN_007468 [Leptodophora sp. 'Broadleaf-Isolate-01']
MIHTSLREAPRYYALSYTWGAPFAGLPSEWDDPKATHTIHVDGHEFEVRWNLEAALKRMCKDEVTVMWIDALCINQSDIPEKNLQVQMMGEIYKNAWYTFVWLGPESDNCSSAQNAISRAIHSWDDRPEYLQRRSITAEDGPEYRVFCHKDLELDTDLEYLRAFNCLLDRTWFRRVWIVQEVVLSQNVLLIWGDRDRGRLARWEWLDETVKLYTQHMYSCMMFQDLQVNKEALVQALFTTTQLATSFNRINDLKRLVENGTSISLPWVLHTIRTFQASNSKDKVYAGLGISSNCDMVRVNYNLTESDVFLDATRAYLETTNDLRILGLCVPSTLANLPSWSVDWMGCTGGHPLGSLRAVGSKTLYCAGGDVPASFKFEHGTSLFIRGVLLGVLSFVSMTEAREAFFGQPACAETSLSLLMDFKAIQRAWLGNWINYQEQTGASQSHLEKYQWTQEDLWEAFARTLCADIMGNEMTQRRLGENYSWSEENLKLLFQAVIPDVLSDRVFAATSSLHFCLVREDAQPGDVVFVAMGAETPYLLRPRDSGKYQFVGQCYVHGFMDGQAIEWMRMDDGRFTECEFEII